MKTNLSRFFPTALVAIAFTLTTAAAAQYSETILHDFTDSGDGDAPVGNVVFDAAGNLYGATLGGGANHQGTIYEISPSSGESILYSFIGPLDGKSPNGGLIMDGAGNLFGTAFVGGPNANGLVFELSPSGNGGWTQKVLHYFQGGTDGSEPLASLAFDSKGSLYGTTFGGGANNLGSVFRLSLTAKGWAEKVIYSFTGGSDGANPRANVTLDAAGNIYGTASIGGSKTNTICVDLGGCGTVFRLSPVNGWHLAPIYTFEGPRGAYPDAGLTFDAAGNLYGTTALGGSCVSSTGCGTAFELVPTSQGAWKHIILHNFTGFTDGASPQAGLTPDSAGDLFGATAEGGPRNLVGGTVFELSPSSSGWTFSTLYQFGAPNDGSGPSGGIILDASGNLYGSTGGGGTSFDGTVYEISPPASIRQ